MASDRRPQYEEGPEAAKRFAASMDRILTVSKDELTKREATYKKSRSSRKPRTKKSA